MSLVVIFFISISSVLTQEIIEQKQGECYSNVCRRKENEKLKNENEGLQWKIQELKEIIRNKDKTINDLKRKYDSSTCGSSTTETMTTAPTESSSTTVPMTTTPTLSSSTGQPRQCQDPKWEAFLNSCYYVGIDASTWASASQNCNNMNMSLAVISTPEENEYVVSLAKGKHVSNFYGYWLDGTDDLREGLWFWNSTGTCITYQNWGPYEPNNMNRAEHCLEIKPAKNYTWNDERCTNARQYICETTI